MATEYGKYINSKSTHYISNSGSDENGRYHGGKAGDQTGKEWQLRKWYSRPWTHVLRHPDARVRERIVRLAIDAALNNNVGYDQYQRYTYWNELVKAGYDAAKIAVKCEADCTAGVNANVKAAGETLGVAKLKALPKAINSRNMLSQYKKAGFEVLTAKKYLTGHSWLLPGDILLCENHHAATNVTRGKNVKEESQDAPKEDPVIPADPLKARVLVTGGTVNVRTKASAVSHRLGTVKKGDRLEYRGIAQGTWYGVRYNGSDAWISAKYSALEEAR